MEKKLSEQLDEFIDELEKDYEKYYKSQTQFTWEEVCRKYYPENYIGTAVVKFEIQPVAYYGRSQTSTAITEYNVIDKLGMVYFTGNYTDCYNFILQHNNIS